VRVSDERARRASAVSGREQGPARRYARALLDVAQAEGGTLPQQMNDELAALARLVATNGELRRAFGHPTLGKDARRRLATAIGEAASLSPLGRRLLDLLASRDRLALVPAIAESYAAAWNAAKGIVTAEAITAVPLTDGERLALTAALCGPAGAKVDLRTSVDPSLLGGVIVRMGGRTYDGSVREHLRELRARLAGN
jgi:F-type H+-transporting ATPase subunit delta